MRSVCIFFTNTPFCKIRHDPSVFPNLIVYCVHGPLSLVNVIERVNASARVVDVKRAQKHFDAVSKSQIYLSNIIMLRRVIYLNV